MANMWESLRQLYLNPSNVDGKPILTRQTAAVPDYALESHQPLRVSSEDGRKNAAVRLDVLCEQNPDYFADILSRTHIACQNSTQGLAVLEKQYEQAERTLGALHSIVQIKRRGGHPDVVEHIENDPNISAKHPGLSYRAAQDNYFNLLRQVNEMRRISKEVTIGRSVLVDILQERAGVSYDPALAAIKRGEDYYYMTGMEDGRRKITSAFAFDKLQTLAHAAGLPQLSPEPKGPPSRWQKITQWMGQQLDRLTDFLKISEFAPKPLPVSVGQEGALDMSRGIDRPGHTGHDFQRAVDPRIMDRPSVPKTQWAAIEEPRLPAVSPLTPNEAQIVGHEAHRIGEITGNDPASAWGEAMAKAGHLPPEQQASSEEQKQAELQARHQAFLAARAAEQGKGQVVDRPGDSNIAMQQLEAAGKINQAAIQAEGTLTVKGVGEAAGQHKASKNPTGLAQLAEFYRLFGKE